MPDADAQSPAPRRFPARGARWALSVALFGLVVALTQRQWHLVAHQALRPQPAWLAVAGMALAAHFVLACEGWRRWLALVGAEVPFGAAFRALFLSNVAKYLPGGAWNYLDRALRLRALGVGTLAASGSMALDMAASVSAALLVGQLATVFGRVPHGAGWGVLGALALIASTHPRVLGPALAIAARLSGHPAPPAPPWRAMLAQLALYTLAWAALGTGFAALAAGLLPTPVEAASTLALVGAFPLAWAIGTLAVFVPAGLGVREGALTLLLTAIVSAPWPIALALAARLWLLLGEAIAFAAAALAPAGEGAGVTTGEREGTKDP